MITGERELQEGDEVNFFAIDLIKKKAERQANCTSWRHPAVAPCCFSWILLLLQDELSTKKKNQCTVAKIIFGGKVVN